MYGKFRPSSTISVLSVRPKNDKRKVHIMLGICTNLGIQTLLYIIIMVILHYWYRLGEGEGGKGGPQVSDCEGFPLAACGSRLSPRLASPRLASPRLEKSSRPAVTVTVAAAVAVTVAQVAVAVPVMCYDAFPGNIY